MVRPETSATVSPPEPAALGSDGGTPAVGPASVRLVQTCLRLQGLGGLEDGVLLLGTQLQRPRVQALFEQARLGQERHQLRLPFGQQFVDGLTAAFGPQRLDDFAMDHHGADLNAARAETCRGGVLRHHCVEEDSR